MSIEFQAKSTSYERIKTCFKVRDREGYFFSLSNAFLICNSLSMRMLLDESIVCFIEV